MFKGECLESLSNLVSQFSGVAFAISLILIVSYPTFSTGNFCIVDTEYSGACWRVNLRCSTVSNTRKVSCVPGGCIYSIFPTALYSLNFYLLPPSSAEFARQCTIHPKHILRCGTCMMIHKMGSDCMVCLLVGRRSTLHLPVQRVWGILMPV